MARLATGQDSALARLRYVPGHDGLLADTRAGGRRVLRTAAPRRGDQLAGRPVVYLD